MERRVETTGEDVRHGSTDGVGRGESRPQSPGGETRPTDAPTVDYSTMPVRTDASAYPCPYCGRPFTAARYRALHVGDAHPDRWTAAERDAYADACDAESDALFVLQLKLLAALVALYFALFVGYAAVWTG
jgi:hypothetical protein